MAYKVISIAGLKGGCGKTMNCFQIGAILAEEHNVLMIDCDPQSNLSNDMNIDISDRDAYSIKDILENTAKNQPDPNDVIVKAPISELPNLDIIPSSILLFRTERMLYAMGDRVRILYNYLNDHQDVFSHYDYIICDTNPSMSFTNQNVFYAADVILLSTDVSSNSLLGAELFCELWDEERESLRKEDNIQGMIIGNYSGTSNLARDLIAHTRQADFSKDIVFDSIINTTVKLKESEAARKPINIYMPKHKATAQYRELVAELFEKEVI